MMQTLSDPSVSPAPQAAGAELLAANEHGEVLRMLLEQEFEARRVQDLDRVQSRQPEKLKIFETLTFLTGVGTPANRLEQPEWDGFRQLIADCRELHRRNEVLISRKLDAIRGTLHTLRGSDPTAPVEVYDRLGRMSRLRGGRGYEEA